jgi:cell wall assembly regulator SMI1
MITLQNYFDRIINKQKQLDYFFTKIIRPPADAQLIAQAEEAIGLTFNNELKELYSFADGTDPGTKEPSGKIALIPIHEFLSLESAIEHYKIQIQFTESFVNYETNYKPGKKLFPFLYDGAGNFYWVDLNNNSENYGKIFWTNTFGDDPDYKFSSLTIFFRVICECYETGVMKLDEEGYLECDGDLFEQISEKYN